MFTRLALKQGVEIKFASRTKPWIDQKERETTLAEYRASAAMELSILGACFMSLTLQSHILIAQAHKELPILRKKLQYFLDPSATSSRANGI